jgi:integrative and conjugative element protein (TIGR02256 family)
MRPVVWLPSSIASEMLAEADRWFDLETGGSFMGYWATDREVVVTAHIPAGPGSKRERFRFEPDLYWQQQRIDEHYAKSGRLDMYLGDWHTHPRATTAQLSYTDRACARGIIAAEEARQPRPIIMLLAGEEGAWRGTPFICTLKRRWRLFSSIDSQEAECQTF